MRSFAKSLVDGAKLVWMVVVACVQALGVLWSYSRGLFAATCATLLVTSVAPFALSMFFGRKLDALGDGSNAFFLSMIILAAWALLQITEQVEAQVARQVEEFFREHYIARLLNLKISLGLRPFDKDDAGLHRDMQLADAGEYWGPRLLQFMVFMISGGARSVVGLTFLVTSWPLQTILPLLVIIPLLAIRLRFAVLIATTERALADNQGRITHFRGKFTKEKDFTALLTLGVGPQLAAHIVNLLRVRKKTINAVHRRTMYAEIVVTLLLAGTLIFVFRQMENAVIAKTVTIGVFSLFWTSLLAAIEGLDRAIGNMGDLSARIDQLAAPRKVEKKYSNILSGRSGEALDTARRETSERMNGDGLAIRELTWGYGQGKPLFEGASLDVPAGLTMVLGTNGAGKTSLLNLLTAIKEPPAGTISLGGLDLAAMPADVLRQLVLHCPQHMGDWTGLTFREPFAFINAEAARDDKLVYEALEWAGVAGTIRETEFGLDSDISVWGNTKVQFKFSGGYNARFNLALIRFAMLTRHARFVLFDEPFANLDGPTIEELLSRMRQLASEGISALLVLHHANLVADSDQVLFLHRQIKGDKPVGPARLCFGTHDELKVSDSSYLAFVERRREELAAV